MGQYREELIRTLARLTKEGFTCYAPTNSEYNFGYILTESGNLLTLQRTTPDYLGWILTLKYPATQKNGTGCQCLENAVHVITPTVVKDAEIQGLDFAKTLKANLFKNKEEALNSIKFLIYKVESEDEEDMDLIEQIAIRAKQLEITSKPLARIMIDVEKVHLKYGLRLQELLKADNSSFAHDICGIDTKLNRRTGELQDLFLPIYVREAKENE